MIVKYSNDVEEEDVENKEAENEDAEDSAGDKDGHVTKMLRQKFEDMTLYKNLNFNA